MTYLTFRPFPTYLLALTVVLSYSSARDIARLSAAEGGFDANTVTVEQIIEVWRAREAATKTFTFEMAESELIGVGTRPDLEAGKVSPPEDVRVKRRRTITVDGTKMFHRITGPTWTHAVDALLFEEMTSVFDGQHAFSLHRREHNTDAVHSRGYIHNKPVHPDVHNLRLSPVIRHYRAISTPFGGLVPDRLKIIDRKAVVEGQKCVVLEHVDSPFRTKRLWLDCDKDMSIVRCCHLLREVVSCQIDVRFEKHPKYGWTPKSWESVRYFNGKVGDSSSNAMESLTLNLPVAKELFTLEFPIGTQVSDYGARRMHLVTKTDPKRFITLEESDRKATYSELMATPSGEAGKSRVAPR